MDMTDYIIIGLLVAILIVALVILLRKTKKGHDDFGIAIKEESANLQRQFFDISRNASANTNETLRQLDSRNIEFMKMLGQLDVNLQNRMLEMLQSNARELEKIRASVDEKLDKTLEARLAKSFETVQASLKNVFEGLGEMKNLAKDVGGLKNVLSNVKVRGTFGEIQLESLLEQILHRSQWEKSYKLNPNTNEMVDFCIRIPVKNDNDLFLPVDCKFPMEQYYRIVEASEQGNVMLIDRACKELEIFIKNQAKEISAKYIVPNRTTDFAVLYLPTEGLYAEVLRRDGLLLFLQKQHVTVAGPTTFGAMLQSFQMGFRTIAMEKRSEEIVKTMQVFRKNFDIFIGDLAKTQKKISEASDQIDVVAKRSEIITKRLAKFDDMSELPENEEIGIRFAE